MILQKAFTTTTEEGEKKKKKNTTVASLGISFSSLPPVLLDL